jgi:tetratricopeptide (TPR) repeat protein
MIRRPIVLLATIAAGAAATPLYAQCAPRAELEARLARTPNDDAAMECLGRALLDAGDSGRAVDWLERAVKANGRSAPHHLWLGHALRDETIKAGTLRQPFLARRMKGEYEQAVALDPALVDARHWLLLFYTNAPAMMGGNMTAAREQAAAILTLDPARGHIDYATIAEQEKDYAAAERELLAAIAAAPATAALYEAAGQFYRRRQRWPEAIAIYETLLTAKPEAVNAHLSLGRVYVNSLKDYDRGEKEVRLWLASRPPDAPAANVSNAHYCLGVVHDQRGRRDQAKVEYQAALAANPNNDDAKKALASAR